MGVKISIAAEWYAGIFRMRVLVQQLLPRKVYVDQIPDL